MLVTCTECGLMVSDKAIVCPHCGYPRKKDRGCNYHSSKRRRLPNGFGQITEIKGHNLRKPFRAMVSIGKTETGRPIQKMLKPEAYFETYNEAYAALVEYNRNPYDLDDDLIVKELYEKWSKEYFQTLKSASSERTIKAAWKYCYPVYSMRVKDLRARHIKSCMETAPSANINGRIKSLFNLMLDYAVEYELTDRNYARTFNASSDTKNVQHGHIAFTDEEMQILWKNITYPYVDIVLYQCYSGWRPQELGLIRLSDVDIANRIVKGGIKTSAGTGRVVPIHDCVVTIIGNRVKEGNSLGGDLLFSCTDTHTHRSSEKLTYDKYQYRFSKIVKALGLNPEHRPHDCRKQFITMAKKYNVDEYAIKRIVGHNISDITEKIYTERDVEWLKTEMNKIKGPDHF